MDIKDALEQIYIQQKDAQILQLGEKLYEELMFLRKNYPAHMDALKLLDMAKIDFQEDIDKLWPLMGVIHPRVYKFFIEIQLLERLNKEMEEQ